MRTFWQSWSPARRRSARAETAALVATLRPALMELRSLDRIADITGSVEDRQAADAARARCRGLWTPIGSSQKALPRLERQLVGRWNHAAAMTWWYRSSDHQQWAPAEAVAAQLVTALPGGTDPDAVSAAVAAIDHRSEFEVGQWFGSDSDTSPAVSDEVKSIDQKELVRRLRANLIEVRGDGAFSDTGRAQEALRNLEPWLADVVAELKQPRSAARCNEIVEQWRALRARFFWHVSHRYDPTQVLIK